MRHSVSHFLALSGDGGVNHCLRCIQRNEVPGFLHQLPFTAPEFSSHQVARKTVGFIACLLFKDAG